MSHLPCPSAKMQRAIALLMLVAAGMLANTSAYCQSGTPYLIDSSGAPARNASGLCWRTGSWSPAAATAAKLDGMPLGCTCEPAMMPAGACESTPAALPPPVIQPARVEPAAPTAPAANPVTPQKVKLSAEAHFQFGQAILDDDTLARLEELATALAQIQLEVVLVVGHADRIGPEDFNQKLSEKRAAAVKLYLIGKGIAAGRIYTEGKGEQQPRHVGDCKADGTEDRRNATLVACLQADRRVEIEAIGVR